MGNTKKDDPQGSGSRVKASAGNQRQRNAEATRGAILDAATRLMLTKGFAASSISEIAREAGVTKSLIHHHFGSKKNLWFEVRNSFLGEFLEAQDHIIKTQMMDRALIEESFEMFFHYLRKNPKVIQLFIWIYAREESLEEEEVLTDMVDYAIARLRDAQKEGRIRGDVDAAFITVAFRVLTQSWFNLRRFFKKYFPDLTEEEYDEAYLNDVKKIFFEGIIPKGD
jgi:TetR/AcrR family transcriptional regulator